MELLPDRLEDLPVLVQLLEPRRDALVAAIDAPFERGHDRHVLDLRRGDLEQGREVAARGRREPLPQQLGVRPASTAVSQALLG